MWMARAHAMGWYLHVDMDAFFASVEQALDPTLRGKPVIVGGRHGRGVVTSASYEARAFGVHSAMPGFKARKLCPHGIFLPNRRSAYSDFSARVFAILKQYSPAVRALSIDEGLVDLAGTEKLFGPPIKTADTILRRIKGELDLPASGGLAADRVVAKIAATLAKPQGLLYIPEGSEEEFLSPLPVKVIPGVGPKAQAALRSRGIDTIAELLKDRSLRDRYLHVSPVTESKREGEHSLGNETTLETPLRYSEKMEEVLWTLVEEVGARLRREGLYARCLTLKIRYSDFQTLTRSRTLGAPTHFDREIFQVVCALLRRHRTPEKAIRLLGVNASALQSSGWQEPLFDSDKRRAWEKLYRSIDELRHKYGDAAIGPAAAHRGR